MSLSFSYVVVDWLPVGLRGVTLGIIFAICQTTMCAIWNTDAAMIEKQFAYCRKMGIEPIPILQSFGHSSRQLGIDPNLAEGSEVVDEKLVLVGATPAALAHRRFEELGVLRRQGVHDHRRSAWGPYLRAPLVGGL